MHIGLIITDKRELLKQKRCIFCTRKSLYIINIIIKTNYSVHKISSETQKSICTDNGIEKSTITKFRKKQSGTNSIVNEYNKLVIISYC